VKLLDTSVAIDHLRGAQPAVDLLSRIIDEEKSVVASEVVRFELLAGVRDHELDALEQFFSALAWVPVDEGITRTAGSLARRQLGPSGVMSAAPGRWVATRRGSRVRNGRAVTAACAPIKKSGRIASRVPPARR